MTAVDWREYPPLMRCEHLAGRTNPKGIYPYTLLTVRKMAQKGNNKIPTPCGRRPFVFRKDDVKRHFDRLGQ